MTRVGPAARELQRGRATAHPRRYGLIAAAQIAALLSGCARTHITYTLADGRVIVYDSTRDSAGTLIMHEDGRIELELSGLASPVNAQTWAGILATLDALEAWIRAASGVGP